MNSRHAKAFFVSVVALGATMILSPSPLWATAEPVWDDGVVATFDDGVHWANGGGEVKSIVCSSAGNCTAVGEFTNPFSFAQAFTMSSVNGMWSRVRPVLFADNVRNTSRESEVLSVPAPQPAIVPPWAPTRMPIGALSHSSLSRPTARGPMPLW